MQALDCPRHQFILDVLGATHDMTLHVGIGIDSQRRTISVAITGSRRPSRRLMPAGSTSAACRWRAAPPSSPTPRKTPTPPT